jgi:HAD superfamily hydrolase (TIGR01459 family)
MDAAANSTFSWDDLPDRYAVILCDIWGVVHDGVRLNAGAADRLTQWREQGRFVLLITNAPRTAQGVERQLETMGLQRSSWDAVVTGGEAGIDVLRTLDHPVGFIGTLDDRAVLESRGVRISGADDVTHVACAGLDGRRSRVEQYGPELERWAERGVLLHCLNADRVVMHGSIAELCAGALADLYMELGGPVAWYGKPHAAIYEHALRLSGNPTPGSVLAVGDGLQTDMLGAARMGFDGVLVSGGIHAHEPFPPDFASANGLGEWRPIASVAGLS